MYYITKYQEAGKHPMGCKEKHTPFFIVWGKIKNVYLSDFFSYF